MFCVGSDKIDAFSILDSARSFSSSIFFSSLGCITEDQCRLHDSTIYSRLCRIFYCLHYQISLWCANRAVNSSQDWTIIKRGLKWGPTVQCREVYLSHLKVMKFLVIILEVIIEINYVTVCNPKQQLAVGRRTGAKKSIERSKNKVIDIIKSGMTSTEIASLYNILRCSLKSIVCRMVQVINAGWRIYDAARVR